MLAEITPRSAPAPRATGGAARRVLLFAFGGLAVLLSAAMLVGGATIAWVDETARDDAGYLTTSTGQFLTNSFAMTSDPFDVEIGNYRKWISDEDALGRVRLQAESADPDVGVFVGIGPTADVERYLADVELDRVSGLSNRPTCDERGLGHQRYPRPSRSGSSQPQDVASRRSPGKPSPAGGPSSP